MLAAIKRHSLSEFSEKEMFDLLDTEALKTMDQLRPALEVLVEREWLRKFPQPPQKPEGGRPPSPRYSVNPAALAP
jgi:hypothetical protein